jgi:nucleotide-binding universal stress UspA family protein
MTRNRLPIATIDDSTAAQFQYQTGGVVVGVDGSPTGRAALQWATREAHLLNAPLIICHVHPLTGLAGAPRVPVGLEEELLNQAVATATRRVDDDHVVAVRGFGDPAQVLARLSLGARMLVIGTHGSFTHGGSLFAPLSSRIISRASCPVVSIPLIAGASGTFRGHVVVGVDGSAASRDALAFGFAHAARHNRPLAAVHVSPEPAGDFWTDDTLLETHFTEEPRAETLLAVEVEPWESKHPDVPTKRAVYGGRAVPGLLRAAAGADLLVVGDRGRRLAVRTVLGSVAQQMIASATCPVAVIRSATKPERS